MNGYGSFTNMVKMEQVYMLTHMEGVGTTESPVREIKTFFTADYTFIARIDPLKKAALEVM